MRRLVGQKAANSRLTIAVLACSKGAEVYSIAWTIRTACPNLQLSVHAVDISEEILQFAKDGVYSLLSPNTSRAQSLGRSGERERVTWNTNRDQNDASIFKYMTDEELEAMFEVEGGKATVRPWLKTGINWLHADAGHSAFVDALGSQDIVVANRFLCHMSPEAADSCLCNVARLVKPGGYLFVSGIDLDVRTRIARAMGWTPVTDLMREIHEGDASLTDGWPLTYWGLEPFCTDRPDWRIRYASVFQIGKTRAVADSAREHAVVG